MVARTGIEPVRKERQGRPGPAIAQRGGVDHARHYLLHLLSRQMAPPNATAPEPQRCRTEAYQQT